MARGLIFDIEEFAVHDGPGIRKTVFFKGCPLRCMWCHNPEGLSFHKELIVNKVSCINCGRCTGICMKDECEACGQCIFTCPLRLRRICGTEVDSGELARILLNDKDFLEKNGGGITISGGEPLAQPEFLIALLTELADIHTAIETSGYGKSEVFKKAVGLTDLVMFDIKHTDPTVHKKVTGVDNGIILENLACLCNGDKDFIIRIPLIPGINDNRANFERVAELVENAKKLIRVELLPYHKTAGAKYSWVGREYRPEFDIEKKPEIYLDVFERLNIRSEVL